MTCKRTERARKASFIAFGLIALAAVASGAAHEEGPAADINTKNTNHAANEAGRAYKQALSTLAFFNDLPIAHDNDRPQGGGLYSYTYGHSSNSLLSTLLPNPQGQGPIASAMRIVMRLKQHSWIPPSITSLFSAQVTGGNSKRDEEYRSKAVKVMDLLQHATELGHSDALYTLAQISLFPPSAFFPFNPKLSFDSYRMHAGRTGNATSQALLGFFYATGYYGAVDHDQAKAQLYLTFAAQGGHKGAQMSLGYRYWSGIGVAENCMSALEYYEDAAEQAMAKFLSGPPGGRTLPFAPARLSDLSGGVYGPGASAASTGLNAGRPVIKTANARAAGETWEDLLEYYLFNADRGEVDFAYRLGKIFYQGSIYGGIGGIASGGDSASAVPRDYHSARHYFLRIARQVWPSDPADPRHSKHTAKEDLPPQAGYAPLAAGYLGRMYLRGEGVKADAAIAKMWFERGADYGEKESQNGLGIIWRDGLVDGKKDTKKALHYFQAAATQELAEAHVQLGKHNYNIGDTVSATRHFEQAVRLGSPFEAYYYLAGLQSSHSKNPLTPRSFVGSACSVAVSFYKLIAERGTWGDDLLQEASESWKIETDRNKELAMLRWWIAAERGFEVAQNNLGFVLDQDRSILRFTRFAPISPSNDTAHLALTQWSRSAAQRNVDALVKVGDYYYHGLGVAEEPEDIRFEKAAGYYQSAADTQMSALAMWNLGWMYENGKGVPQDYHLAKRHYDLALDTNQEAYLPVVISLVHLHVKSLWYALSGGPDELNLWRFIEEDDVVSPKKPETHNIDDGRDRTESANDEHGEESDDDEDGLWYIGKAKEDFKRRQQGGSGGPNDVDDPVQWARDRRHAENNDRDSDFGPDDFFEGGMRGGHRVEEDVDEFAETMLLVFLCIAVSTLLFIRGRWMERVRRELNQQPRDDQQNNNNGAVQQGAGEGGGLYPPPGDVAARNDWNVVR